MYVNSMQTNQGKKGHVERKHISKHRFPKKIPTYVVAFAMQETHDGLKLECNRKSHTSNSICPSGSKDSKNTQRMFSEGDGHINCNEIKININDDEQLEHKLPMEENGHNVCKYVIEDLVNENDSIKQPEVLFDCTKNKKRKNQKNKPVNCRRNIYLKNTKRNIYYKNKNNKLTKKIQKHYTDKHSTVAQIQKDLYVDCLTEVVSRYRVVKTALAKENLLEAINQEFESNQEAELVNVYDSQSKLDNDSLGCDSMGSSISTEKNDSSYTSQNTLVQKSFNSNNDAFIDYSVQPQGSSNKDETLDKALLNSIEPCNINSTESKSADSISVHTDPSIIEIKSETLIPYQSNIINVAVAVTDMANKKMFCDIIKEKTKYDSLTSVEFNVTTHDLSGLTSEEPSSRFCNESSDTSTLNIRKSSDTTLIDESKSNESNDNLTSAKTKAAQNNASIFTFGSGKMHRNHRKIFSSGFDCESNNTLKENLDSIVNVCRTPRFSVSPTGQLDEIKNNPLTTNNINDVILTNENIANILKIRRANRKYASLLKKKNSANGEIKRRKCSAMSNLPEGTLKELIKNEEKKLFSSENMAGIPADNRNDLWEKVTVVLDVITQRLEHSLADKIIKEIKTISNTQQAKYESKAFGTDLMETRGAEEKQVFEKGNSLYSHNSFQCDLVDNKVLDDLMLKLSMDGPKIVPPHKPPKLKIIEKPIHYKEVEVLKSPTVKCLPEEVITVEESLTTTSTLAAGVKRDRKLMSQRLKYALKVPYLFIKENLFVIVTIPTFFVFMFVMYIMMVLFVKLV